MNKILFILIFLVILVFLVTLIHSVWAGSWYQGHYFTSWNEYCRYTNIEAMDNDSYKREPERPITERVLRPSENSCGNNDKGTALTAWGRCYNDERKEWFDDFCGSDPANCKIVSECYIEGKWFAKDYSGQIGFDCPADLICWDGACQSPRANGQSCDYDCHCASGNCDKGKCAPQLTGCQLCGDGTWNCTGAQPENQRCGDNGQIGNVVVANLGCSVNDDKRFYCTGNQWHSCSDSSSWAWTEYDLRGGDTAGDRCCDPSQVGAAKWSYCGDGNVNTVCGEECESNADCSKYCVSDTRYYKGKCSSTCKCSYSTEDCNDDDGCYSYSDGCEDRDYYCLAGACPYSVSNRHTDSYDSYVNYCSGDTVRKHRLFHDWYCTGGTCTDHTSWVNDQLVENCNNYDGCVGTTYRDYYCSGGACAYTNYPDDPRCNQAPSVPTLQAPSHNVWINYNPTFQASATDPNGDNIRVWFEVSGHGSNWGSWVGSGGTSSWGPRNVGNCFVNWWRGYTQDSKGATSGWSGSWLVKVDKDNPSATIDQENGTSTDTSIWVNLSESDGCSGVAEGNVDVKINGGSWVNTGLPNGGSTIDNFVYTGVDGNTYEFRYQVKDNAGNWSSFNYDGSVTVDINDSPAATNLNKISPPNWCGTPSYFFSWTFSDPDSDDKESRFDFQILEGGSPVVDRTFDGLSNPNPCQNSQIATVAVSLSDPDIHYGRTYSWRVRVWDNNDPPANSVWVSGGLFNTADHHGPTPDFTLSPTKPSALESVRFTDKSECYDDVFSGSDCTDPNDEFKWTIEKTTQGDPLVTFGEIVTATFSEAGTWKVKLEVTDNHDYMCSEEKSIKVSQPLPEWREVKPK